jgi:hypothetical protein
VALVEITEPYTTSFRRWTGERALATIGTNAGSTALPFQTWRKFKEAFAPEIVARAVGEHPTRVTAVLDPFGGSGTTALAAQFLGVVPTTIEINPYLADLIESKLCRYRSGAIATGLRQLLESPEIGEEHLTLLASTMPPTFVQPGVDNRWIFNRSLAHEAFRLREGLSRVTDLNARRLLKILLGAALVNASNIVISGKGRRYRRGWENKESSTEAFLEGYIADVGRAARDIAAHNGDRTHKYNLIRGDARQAVLSAPLVDLAIYSPPYPNSFDYTDVYNVELWMLGYLGGREDNTALRRSTLSSHVQISRKFPETPLGSNVLSAAVGELRTVRGSLWNPQIPEMVGGYFADLLQVIDLVSTRLRPGGRQWMVVGDSRYANIDVPVAAILRELLEHRGRTVHHNEPFRSMRAAPQQGGRPELSETLLVFS